MVKLNLIGNFKFLDYFNRICVSQFLVRDCSSCSSSSFGVDVLKIPVPWRSDVRPLPQACLAKAELCARKVKAHVKFREKRDNDHLLGWRVIRNGASSFLGVSEPCSSVMNE